MTNSDNDQFAKVKELYPDVEWTYGTGSYQPMVDSFGRVILQVDDHDYQGDTRVLYEKDGLYGLLIFGWGSCSGCDALQACTCIEDAENLRARLESSIDWKSASELLNYVLTHDWEGDYSGSSSEAKEFVEKAKELLQAIIAK